MFALGLALFTLASAACGLAPSPTTLVIARVAQGVAGALVMPQVLAIIGVTYRGTDYVRAIEHLRRRARARRGRRPAHRRRAGRDRLAGLGWRGCFLINVPIGLAALALTPRLVPESRRRRRTRLDVAGARAGAPA